MMILQLRCSAALRCNVGANPLAFLTQIRQTNAMSRLLSLTAVAFFVNLPSLLACEGCKEPSSVAGQSGVAGISASFSWSVLFMLGVVTVLLTGMVLMMIRSCKELAAQQNPEAVPVEPANDLLVTFRRACTGSWRVLRGIALQKRAMRFRDSATGALS
jgi:hypothetical protein